MYYLNFYFDTKVGMPYHSSLLQFKLLSPMKIYMGRLDFCLPFTGGKILSCSYFLRPKIVILCQNKDRSSNALGLMYNIKVSIQLNTNK